MARTLSPAVSSCSGLPERGKVSWKIRVAVSALTTDALAGLNEERAQALSSTQAGSLTTDQLRSLTTDQVATLGAEQAAGLKSTQLAALSTDDGPLMKWRSAADAWCAAALWTGADAPTNGLVKEWIAAATGMPTTMPQTQLRTSLDRAVAVPVRDAQRGVAPLRLGGALDAAVRSGHEADDLAVGFEATRRGPLRLLNAGAAEVLEELEVARRVAAEDVDVAVAVPIEADGRGERAALQVIGLLLEVARREELRRAVGGELAGVQQQRDAPVLVADDEVGMAVLVPVERDRDDHLQVHRERLAVRQLHATTRCVARLRARADVLEVGEAVEELAAQQVEVAVAVEVHEVRRRAAEGVDRLAARFNFARRVVARLRRRAEILEPVDETVERAVGPFARAIVGVVPAVFRPVIRADDEIDRAVAIEIDVAPEIPAIAETYPDCVGEVWVGLFAPQGIPADVSRTIQVAMEKALAQTELREKLIAQGLDITPVPANQLNNKLKEEITKWKKIVKESGAHLD